MNTIEIIIETSDQLLREQIIAGLSEINFDAFEERENQLAAFINEEKFDVDIVSGILQKHHLSFTYSAIAEQNWNALWESNFEPVIVDTFCVIRADFHLHFPDMMHEIIITPKMSFGTGHHATTYMMISEMSRIDFRNKIVADFGTGTGVLAILAEKSGSKYVQAIDNDDWSIVNSKENFERNNCTKIDLLKTDHFEPNQKLDIILANINKNVILSNLTNLVAALNEQGILLLSGLLLQDESEIINACDINALHHIQTVQKNNWICLLFKYY